MADDNTGSVKHANEYTPCSIGVVYRIPCTCGSAYIVQTARCVNIRLREYDNSLKGGVCSHLASHRRERGRAPSFSQSSIITHRDDQRAREVAEAYHIAKGDCNCISQPSVSLSEKEIIFIDQS